jgi:hypothetical protein
MSKSHLVNKEFGSIILNNEQISAISGELFIDNNPLGDSSSNSTIGSLYNLTPTYGSLQITNQLVCYADTNGSLTNTGLLVTNNNFSTFGEFNGAAVGSTSGSLVV